MAKQFLFVNDTLDGYYDESLGAWEQSDHISIRTSTGDQYFPIITNNEGYVDISFIKQSDIDHGSLSGLSDDDHTQYILVDGTRNFTGIVSYSSHPTFISPTQIVDKQYVDNVAQGLDVKGSARVATSSNITLSGLQTIDGVLISAGDRILVKNQTSSEDNGIYYSSTGSWVRTEDANSYEEYVSAFTFVEEGTTHKDTGWVCIADQGGTLGTTALLWTQFSGAGTYSASYGIELVGTEFKLDLYSGGGLKIIGTEVAVEPNDFAGDGIIDDGSDNLAIDWATVFTINGADAKAFKASDIASTVNGKGASIVGIEDASAYYTGIDLETVLNEIEAQIGGATSTTYDFTENNVLTDNDPIYNALNKLDLKWGDLSSTTNNEGASLVGIEDAGNYTTETTVEGSIQELYQKNVTPGVTYTAGNNITKGDLVYISGADTASTYSNIQIREYAIGIAASTVSTGNPFVVLSNDSLATSILAGASAGDEYFWTGSAWSANFITAFSSGDFRYQGGVAKNGNDLHVEVKFISRKR